MKAISTILLSTLFFFTSLNAQVVNESLYEYSRKYTDLWGGDQRKLDINFIREYTLEKTDTSYFMTFSLYNKDVESIYSMSYNYSLGVGINQQKIVDEKSSSYRISKDEFLPFVRCLNKSFVHINNPNVTNTMIACDLQGFTFGVEKRKEKVFYFSNKGTMFKMNQPDFIALITMFRKALEIIGEKV